MQKESDRDIISARTDVPLKQEVAADKVVDMPLQSAGKPSKKELLIHELKVAGLTVGYLFLSLFLLETYKSLVLLQKGINEFHRNYIFAVIEVIALGKIVALTQNMPFLKACSRHSRAIAILYQAAVMTLITDVGGRIEDMLFPRYAALLSQSGEPLALAITHQFVAMLIFILLFTVRAIDEALGPGKLSRLIFSPADAKT